MQQYLKCKSIFIPEGAPLEQNMMSAALFALATGNIVSVNGNGSCTSTNYEEIDYPYVKSN